MKRTKLNGGNDGNGGNGNLVAELPISNLKFGNYQRNLDERRVKIIIAHFDQNRMRPIEVSYRDGFYWVFDGQHRAAVYATMGIKTIPCQIHHGLTYEDEAMLFVKQQDYVGRITLANEWNALIEAGNTKALELIEIADEMGYAIQANRAGEPNKISAIKAINNIVDKLGFEGLQNILKITRICWNNQKNAACGDILHGLMLFISLYSDCEGFDINKLINKLSKKSVASFLAEAEIPMDKTPKYKIIAKNLYFTYNKGVCRTNKLPYKFEY